MVAFCEAPPVKKLLMLSLKVDKILRLNWWYVDQSDQTGKVVPCHGLRDKFTRFQGGLCTFHLLPLKTRVSRYFFKKKKKIRTGIILNIQGDVCKCMRDVSE